MSRHPWPIDVELLLRRGTLEGPFRRFGPMTASRRAVRMVRALWRDIKNTTVRLCGIHPINARRRAVRMVRALWRDIKNTAARVRGIWSKS